MANDKKKYNIPVGYSFFQTILNSVAFLKNPILFISKSTERFSDTYSTTLKIKKKIILTQDPGFINYVLKENHKNYKKSKLSTENAARLLGNGLLFSNGEYWLRQRRVIQPAFHREKLQGLNSNIINSILDSLKDFPTGENIDICPVIHKISFQILIKSLFDIHFPAQKIREINSLFNELLNFLITDTNQPFRKIFYPINGKEKIALEKSKRLKEIFAEIIRERKSKNQPYSDLLDMLLNSRYEDTGEAMSEEQIVDELIIIVFAGHETSANSISWLLYLLASNKDKLEKLKTILNSITIDEALKNEYFKATIYEGLRLYPAAWMTDREAIEDDQFGDYSFPKGTTVISFIYGLHRNKKNWENESVFEPERFISNPGILKSKNFYPFGAGPRMCIGNNFALTEISFFLYQYLKTFEIATTGQIPIMKPLMTLRADKIVLKINKSNP